VPDDKVLWKVPFDDYNPVDYTDPSTKGKPWADADITPDAKFNWNNNDGKTDRTSHMGYVFMVEPLNFGIFKANTKLWTSDLKIQLDVLA
jgi:hypothetical protein